MDQEGPRVDFNKAFYEFITGVELTEKFMNQLSEHPCHYLLPSLENFPDDVAKKCRIFSEFTLVRDNTERLAEALEQSGQADAAKQLRKFNLSEKPWANSYDIHLNVEPARALRSDTSKELKMDANPRGVALIFVTEPDLSLEAERFRSICEQLLFEPYLHQGFTKMQIVARLTEVAQSKKKYKGDAFVMIFIGHGYNEKIIGWSAGGDDNVLPIRDIVDMFSETRCRALRQKTKVFVFNCCRVKFAEEALPLPDAQPVNIGSECAKCHGRLACTKCEPTMMDTLQHLDPQWKKENKQTHVIYACAEGLKAWYDQVSGPIGHVSVFGQALSHTIAQYSWYKSLYQLFLMSVKRSEEELEKSGDPERRPEINMFAVNKELFFNPGQWREESDDLSD
ncbi:unnamed protein product [Medioppia subpectinata]|uniref:Caspase family p20 domain-containing protein n=1 Tax=Medioppia subpectinata TaxID=1979941 RepID=A0A7R9KT46_9ACAR|nr:unnamed protein product [Medioppia subpectinata]CAG2108958.1 unnamed protein product [Medioppia subpectinata]